MRHPKNGEVAVEEYRMIQCESIDGNVLRITMDRPEKRNAQDSRMLVELDDAFQKAEQDDDVNVAILSGAGEDFSSGHDMAGQQDEPLSQDWKDEHREGIEDQWRVEREYFFEHAMKIRNLNIPTIASIQGNCIIGGLMIADVCDLIIASEDAKFSNSGVRMAGTGAEVMTLPWSMGVRKTKELLWTGDPLYAADAKRLGLVNRVVPRDDLADETEFLARRIALMPPKAVELTKKSLNNTLDEMGQVSSLEYHFAIHQIGHRTDERENWGEGAKEARQKDGFAGWVGYRDNKFRDLADEFDKKDPHVE